MTHRFSRRYSLGVVAAFFVILALLAASAVLAQVPGSGRLSEKQRDVSVPDERASARGLHGKYGARPPDREYPLSFVPAVSYGSGGPDASGFSIAIADVNGDGKPDLVVAEADFLAQVVGAVAVLLGNGDGTFQPAITYASGGAFATSVAVADLNGDGKRDVVVANCAPAVYGYCWNGSGVGVLLGNGDGTLQPVVTYDSGDGADSVAIADVNRDGKPDVVIANSIGINVSVLLGNGDGTLQSAVTYYAGSNVGAVVIADVNGDSKPDLVTANYGSNTVGILLGNGDGTFRPVVSYGSGGYAPDSVAVADVNGDGKPDIVVANYCDVPLNQCHDVGASVAVLLGNGDGTFRPAVTYDSQGSLATSVAVADVNGDGKPDLLVANYGNNTVGVLLGNGGGTFQPAVTYNSCGGCAVWEGPRSVMARDLSGDGKADLVVANPANSPNVSVLVNNSGSPPTTTTLVSSLNPVPMRTAVKYMATVAPAGEGEVTGLVVFQDRGSTVATVPLANNQATYSTMYTKGGSHPITATYSGDAHNLGSASATVTEYIESVLSKTIVTTSSSPSVVGQPVTFTATVTPKLGVIPDGELVTFYNASSAIGTGATASGVATFTTSSLTAKAHLIKAKYSGDATFAPSVGLVEQVVDKDAPTTALSSSANPSGYGQAVTFTATVTSAGPTPTGKVGFKDGTKGIGTVTLSGGVAKLTTSKLAVGTHSITAEYLGDADNAKSTSPVLGQVVD